MKIISILKNEGRHGRNSLHCSFVLINKMIEANVLYLLILE